MNKGMSKAAFILLSGLFLCILIMLLSRFFIPKDAGLAGGPMILAYGIIAFLAGLVVSFAIRNKIPDSYRNIINIALLLICASFFIWMFLQMKKEQAGQQVEIPIGRQSIDGKIPDPDITAELYLDRRIGIGMAKFIIRVDQNLNIYKDPSQKPFDFLRFKMGTNSVELEHNPKSFQPELINIEYNFLFFKCISQVDNFLEVEINKKKGETAWILKKDLRFLPWSEFLFTVSSLEPVNWNKNPLRTSPDQAAPSVKDIDQSYTLKPTIIQTNWMQVEVYDNNLHAIKKGWIQWKSDSELLVKYHLMF